MVFFFVGLLIYLQAEFFDKYKVCVFLCSFSFGWLRFGILWHKPSSHYVDIDVICCR